MQNQRVNLIQIVIVEFDDEEIYDPLTKMNLSVSLFTKYSQQLPESSVKILIINKGDSWS